MKNCMAGMFCECNGDSVETKHYEVYSGKKATYPNRFWGIMAYCEAAKNDEESKGYLCVEVDPQQTYVL